MGVYFYHYPPPSLVLANQTAYRGLKFLHWMDEKYMHVQQLPFFKGPCPLPPNLSHSCTSTPYP